MNSADIRKMISVEQAFQLVEVLGGSPIMINDRSFHAMTICHQGHSHKLYYYDNGEGGIFSCYTNCGTFDVFELILKIKKQDGIDWVLPQAVGYIVNFYGLTVQSENFEITQDELQDWKILKKYDKNSSQEKEEKVIEFKFYDKKILKYLPHPHIVPWEQEGITREVMEAYGICYNPSSQAIVIPHYDIDKNLIGIRERTLIKENEVNGKYKPAIINGQMYNHPLGFALYNLNNSKEVIKKLKKVFVFEGEKSCLLYASYFGIENDLSVAVCGSSLVNYQVDLLLSLGIEELIISFDKQFKEIGDSEWKAWTKKLKDIHKKYGAKVQVSYLFDKQNLLGYKDSPIDCGPDVFMKLFKERVIL